MKDTKVKQAMRNVYNSMPSITKEQNHMITKLTEYALYIFAGLLGVKSVENGRS